MKDKKDEEEKEAWAKMKESNKYFFKYARSKLKFKAPIGPFTNKEGNIIKESECVTLNYTKLYLGSQN